jgi:hypothetical protein
LFTTPAIHHGISWSSRNRAAHATPEETGCANNLPLVAKTTWKDDIFKDSVK